MKVGDSMKREMKYSEFIKKSKELFKHEDSDIQVMDKGVPLFVVSKPELKKVGMNVYVEYYKIFKRDDAIKYLPVRYTMSSRRVRANAARKLHDKDLNIDALFHIMNSPRADFKTREMAKKRLVEEGHDIDQRELQLTSMVKELFPLLLDNGLLDKSLDQLLTLDYSKDTFGLQYPLFTEIEYYYEKDDKRVDSNKYPRYYKNSYKYKDREFLLCSHWDEKRHLERFENYMIRILKPIKVKDTYLLHCNTRIKEELKKDA